MMIYGSSGGQDEEDQVFEQLPLLDSVQEIITKEKLVLEFSLAEKDETIAMLRAQCAELEQALKQKVCTYVHRSYFYGRDECNFTSYTHSLLPISPQKHQMAKGLRTSSQGGSSPFAFPDAADVLVGHCLDLSNRGLNLRRFPLIIKQYRCIQKQVGLRPLCLIPPFSHCPPPSPNHLPPLSQKPGRYLGLRQKQSRR